MSKQDWSTKKSDLFKTFAGTVNELNENKYDLEDAEFNTQLESLYDSMPEEWLESLENNPKETTTQYFKALQEQGDEQEVQYAKKGAKLEYIQKLKGGNKKAKGKKCKCGCEMEDGGSVCKCCNGGTLQYHKDGGKVIPKKQEGGETWKKSETGDKSMNPKDWTKSKGEKAFDKNLRNEKAVERLKRPVDKTEIVPLKSTGKKDYLNNSTKKEEKGGELKLVKKKQLGGIAKPKTVEVGKEKVAIKNYVKTSKCGGNIKEEIGGKFKKKVISKKSKTDK